MGPLYHCQKNTTKNPPSDPKAYLTALKKFAKPGDVCSVFTPDDTHFEIIEAALDHGECLQCFPQLAFAVASVHTLYYILLLHTLLVFVTLFLIEWPDVALLHILRSDTCFLASFCAFWLLVRFFVLPA